METKLDFRRIAVFIAFAFGIAWLTGLVIFLTGGLTGSPEILPGVFTLAGLLLATTYMGAPALGNVLTRLVTREGWKDMKLRPKFGRGWPYWLAAWVLPPILIWVGAGIYFLLFPGNFDSTFSQVQSMLAGSPDTVNIAPGMIILLELGISIVISPIVNALFTFGEEFGWRAYLLPRLMPLGGRAAVLVLGVIWGIWHWPVIFMGYEYGFGYPGYPWLGPILFLWVTVCFGVLLGWVTLRSGSVWPAVIGHAAINGNAGGPVLVTLGNPNPLLGPISVGVIGLLGFTILAVVLFVMPNALQPEEAGSTA